MASHEQLHSPLLPPSQAPPSRAAALLHACLAYHQVFFLLLGPLSFVVLIICLDVEDNTGKSGAMVAAMSWMFIWWVTEAIPLAITALIPLFLLPFLQIQTASAVSKSYTNDTVFLILGSFILAAAVRYHKLHKRLAIHIILLFGSDPRLLLFGFCMGAAFISMWVDNAAAAAMLLPMATGIQQKVHAGFHPQCFTDDEEQDDGNPDNKKQDILSRHSSAISEGDEWEHFGDATKEVSSVTSKDGPVRAHAISIPAHDLKEDEHDSSGPMSSRSDVKGPSRTCSLPRFKSKELPSNISRRKSLPVYASKQLERHASERLEKHLSNVLLRMDPEEALKIEMDFCKGVPISIAVAVTIGGMSTLTGNAVNLVFTGIWETDFPKEDPIYFLQWMLFAVPFSLVLVLVLWVLLCIWFCPPSAVKPVSASLHSYQMADELVRLGPITSDQIVILIVFSILVVLWMTKSLTGDAAGWSALFNDYPGNGTVTILMAVSLFVIPNPRDPKLKLMDWSQCRDIPWDVILLIGGGFALANGIKSSGLSDVISREMDFLDSTPYWAITPAIATVIAIVTEFTSNSATASVFVPLAAEIAVSINRHPLFLMVPATLASQFSYMLPTATGPNALAYATESMQIKDMAAPGLVLKIISIILLSILMPTFGTVVFNTNSTVQT